MRRLLAVLLGIQLVVVALGGTVLAPAADAQDARQRCIPSVPGLYPHGVTGGRDAVLMIHGWTGTPAAWTQPIDARVSSSNRAHGFTLVEQVKRLGDVDVWLLDYHDASKRWVTDPSVGGVVAEAIDCLADAYARSIGVVAHSTGGLAVRQVANEGDRASRIAALVTFGTPHTGSREAAILASGLGLPSMTEWLGLVRAGHLYLLKACGLLTSLQSTVCDPLRLTIDAVGSEAGRALHPGSPEMERLPALPVTLPSLSLGGDLELVPQQSFGLFYQDLGGTRFGDVIVTADSAIAQGSETELYRCRHNLRSDFGVLGFVRSELGFDTNDERGALSIAWSPCLHWRLMRGLEQTNHAIVSFMSTSVGRGQVTADPSGSPTTPPDRARVSAAPHGAWSRSCWCSTSPRR